MFGDLVLGFDRVRMIEIPVDVVEKSDLSNSQLPGCPK
jgi:hypothetical protein